MVLTSVLAAMAALIAMGAALKLLQRSRRRRVAGQIPASKVLRVARAVPVRVMLHDTGPVCGLDPRWSHRLIVDLVLSKGRVLLASSRGAIADVGPGRGLLFRSVRCTGPSRLVFEGQIPQRNGRQGQYRYEIFLPDAVGWARALQPFVDPAGQGPYATAPPWMERSPLA